LLFCFSFPPNEIFPFPQFDVAFHHGLLSIHHITQFHCHHCTAAWFLWLFLLSLWGYLLFVHLPPSLLQLSWSSSWLIKDWGIQGRLFHLTCDLDLLSLFWTAASHSPAQMHCTASTAAHALNLACPWCKAKNNIIYHHQHSVSETSKSKVVRTSSHATCSMKAPRLNGLQLLTGSRHQVGMLMSKLWKWMVTLITFKNWSMLNWPCWCW